METDYTSQDETDVATHDMPVNTYYFNTSDGGPTDPDGVWGNDANAFDGETINRALVGWEDEGDENTNYLKGEGTNATDIGGTINGVRARVWAGAIVFTTGVAKIYTDGEAETLATINYTGVGWNDWVDLVAPSGGWTFAKIQALEVVFWATSGATTQFFKLELFVEHTTGSESFPHDVSGTIKGAKYIYNLKRGNGSGTSMRYIFGNTGDGETSSADIEATLTTAYQIVEELSEAAGVVPLSSEDFSFGISAGTDDTGGRSIFAADIWAMLLHVPAAGGHTAEAAQTLGNYSQSASGAHPHSADGAQILSDFLQAASIDEDFVIEASLALADYLQAATVTMNPDGVGTQTLSDYLQSGTILQIFTPDGVQVLSNYLQSGAATSLETFTIDGEQTLEDYLQAGVGVHPHSALGIQVLADYLQSGGAVQIFVSTGAQSLANFLQNGNGIMIPSGAGALTLADFEQAGVVVELYTITAGQTLPDYLQAGTSLLTFSVSGDSTLAELQQAGIVVMIPAGTGIQTADNRVDP